MKLLRTATAVALSLATLIFGAALPEPNTSVAISEREVANGAYCLMNNVEWVTAFQITTWGSWDDDWGQGFIDNINGQCVCEQGSLFLPPRYASLSPCFIPCTSFAPNSFRKRAIPAHFFSKRAQIGNY